MPTPSLRERVHTAIFGTETRIGRFFDIALIWAIVLSVLAVMLESVESVRTHAATPLKIAEWFFTILFTAEYAVRVWCSPRPWHYARSFFGVVDLLAVMPTYLALFFPGLHAFGVIRIFRLLRLFRVFKLLRYMREASVLAKALRNAQPKIIVFLVTLSGITISLGSLMYLIEGPASGFTSIPKGIYWAIITVTTVGYGDLAPHTVLGQTIASIAMILGYAVIAVPTGIISAEWANAARSPEFQHACPDCGKTGHAEDARHCRECGTALKTDPAL